MSACLALPLCPPLLQKEVVRLCRQMGKPVIVASHLLQSMHTLPTPTRAEASGGWRAFLRPLLPACRLCCAALPQCPVACHPPCQCLSLPASHLLTLPHLPLLPGRSAM